MGEATKVSREDLYNQVWSEPVIKAAEKYGITGTALSKICRKLNVPLPPVGYWQKKQHGHAVDRPSLPPLPEGAKEVVILKTASGDRRELAPYAGERLAFERDEKNKIQVSDRLVNPHPLVRQTAETLRTRKPDRLGLLWRQRNEKCLDLRVSPNALPRALRIMDALVKALESRGMKVAIGESEKRETYIHLFGEKVEFRLEEKVDRVNHQPTQEEKKRLEKNPYALVEKWDHMPTGILRLRIEEFAEGERKQWTDGRAKIEEALNDFVSGMILVADAKRARTLYWKRWEEEQREAARQRAEREREQQRAAERLKALRDEAAAWAVSQQIRGYVEAVERKALKRGMSAEPGGRLHEWLEWARGQAGRLDPVASILAALEPPQR